MPTATLAPAPLRRRGFLAGLGALGLAAGCAGPGTATDGSGGGTRTIEGAFGPVEVPVRPERVVAMYPTAADYALVLGLPLVGSSGARGNALAEFPSHQPAELMRDVKRVSTFPGPDFESIAALAPDLIFDDFSVSEPDVHQRLVQIAPVHSFPAFEQSEQLGWRDHLARSAEVFGTQQRVATFVADHDARAAALRERVATRWAGRTFAYVNPNNDDWNIAQATNQTSLTLARDLGLALDPVNPATYTERQTYSLEQLGVLTDVDLLVVRVEAAEEGAGTDRDDLAGTLGSPLWTRLPAVQAGDVVEVEAELFYNSPYTALANLDWAGRTIT